MRSHQRISAWLNKGIIVALVLAASVPLVAWVAGGNSASAAAQAGKLEATIFSYDGKDFVRTKTSLVTEQGASAANTKLDHASAAYKALVGKHSFSGEATVFGKKYEAHYAPLTGADGKLTGALFVGVPK
jgi:predicted membrane-bound mannosyltransferase